MYQSLWKHSGVPKYPDLLKLKQIFRRRQAALLPVRRPLRQPQARIRLFPKRLQSFMMSSSLGSLFLFFHKKLLLLINLMIQQQLLSFFKGPLDWINLSLSSLNQAILRNHSNLIYLKTNNPMLEDIPFLEIF
jgi:hypothetical protein